MFVARYNLATALLALFWNVAPFQAFAAAEQPLWQITVMPKLVDIPYYDQVKRGVMAADAEIEAVSVHWVGPARNLADRQLALLEQELSLGPDLIAVAANEPVAIGNFFRKAEQLGIIPISWDGDASYRQFFVNLVDYQLFANTLVDRLVALVPPGSKISIITTSFESPNQARWLQEIKKRLYLSHPDLEIDDIQAAGESELQAYRIASDYLTQKKPPNAIIALGVPNLPGAARAIEHLSMSGRVYLLGNSTLDLIQPFIERGTVQLALSWNPEDHGYLVVYSALRILQGKVAAGIPFQAGRLGTIIPSKDDKSLQVSLPLLILDKQYLSNTGVLEP